MRFTLAVVLLLTSLTVVGCADEQEQELPPPAAAIQSLLELRVARSADATAYARHFESTEVASVLAEDAAKNKDKNPIPDWEAPEVEESGETTATVIVVWKPSKDFKDWPASTAFEMKKVAGRWVVVDAAEVESSDSTSTPSGGSAPSGEPSPAETP